LEIIAEKKEYQLSDAGNYRIIRGVREDMIKNAGQ
jgi:hypothetical protein